MAKAAAPPADTADTPEPAEGEAAPAAASSKKRMMIIAGAAVLLLAGGGGGAWFFLGGSGEAGEEEHGKASGKDSGGDHGKPAKGHGSGGKDGGGGHGGGDISTMVDVPAMTVNIRSPGGESRYLKLRFMIVAAEAEAVEGMKSKVPAVIDAFQPFLRELRPEDVAGAAGVYRIKEELMIRAGDVMGADAVADILIQELIQQ